jgi:hypothetical protein
MGFHGTNGDQWDFMGFLSHGGSTRKTMAEVWMIWGYHDSGNLHLTIKNYGKNWISHDLSNHHMDLTLICTS